MRKKITGRNLALGILSISNKPLSAKDILDIAKEKGLCRYLYPGTAINQKVQSFNSMLYIWNHEERGYFPPKIKISDSNPKRFSLTNRYKPKYKNLIKNFLRRGRYGEDEIKEKKKEKIINEKIIINGEKVPFPTDEQGVRYIFHKLESKLGFKVLKTRTRFPDCIVRHRGEEKYIEFEYKSSNFKIHNHDPDECDIIVCWIDDYDDCPIEVICLSKLVNDIREGKI